MELKRDLGISTLTLAVVSSTIGSGWLFAPYFSARSAGPASLLAWVVGGAMAFVLALVFAELGALVNSSGALAQIPLLSHGRLSGFIGGWSAWISYVSLPTIEVLALLQYLASSLPWLTHDEGGQQLLTGAGQLLAVALLVFFTWINLAGVNRLAQWIDSLTIWKLIVPVLVSVTLMLLAGHWGNLGIRVPMGQGALVDAIGSGGILFSLLGFRTAMDLAGEARSPQRDVPLAMGLGLGLCLGIYLILQLAFLVSVPPADLAGGWSRLTLSAHGGPMVALALGLGLGWVATLLLIDAVISPGATALTFVGVSARVSWMMGECGLLPKGLGRLNNRGVPHWALISSLVIGSALLWIGPSWQTVVSFLTSTLVIALAMGPVSLLSLRRQLPNEPRRFRIPQARLLCSIAFVMATWATSWCGRPALEGAVVVILIPTLIYVANRWRQRQPIDARAGLWWILYLGLLLLDMELFSEGQPFALPTGLHLLLLTVLALVVLPLAVKNALPQVSPHALTGLGAGDPTG
ncbi:APC family permease [Synechococcus sp. HK01-R]|uniref:APC family permease n=1 Tax=Synechococcus sp. HK01-R TaxID=2751171 RepID=UPI001625B039|nr:APC family permease [Synechococcus sp. HK01-R]QNG27617.1 APC family permease [Synechococcus sp. HK01-R]